MGILSILFSEGNKIGNIEIDVVLSEGASSKVTATKNPVAKGADTTDHIRVEPMTFTFVGMVSDTPVKFLGNISNVFKSSGARISLQTWNKLLKLQADREPFTLRQNLRSYNNIFIESLDYTQDKESSNVLLFTCKMSELIYVGQDETNIEKITDQDVNDKSIVTQILGRLDLI